MGSIMDAGLSAAARVVWAKTHVDKDDGFALDGWLPLAQHLDDAAGVAAHLWDEWAPRSITGLLTRAVGSAEAARSLVIWSAGVHDVGKASPAFAVQVPVLADDMRDAGLIADRSIKDGEERRRVRHELVGFLAIREWLRDEHGFPLKSAAALASVTAAHHGRPPAALLVRDAQARPHLVGTGSWADVRREFLDAARGAFVDAGHLDAWRGARFTEPVLVILSALVIVADWIASSDLFPPAPLKQPAVSPTEARVAAAWETLDFPRRWQLTDDGLDAADMLSSRFELPERALPHIFQRAFIDMARTIDQPELMILESEMGSGKTEAALAAAEILAARFGMSGVFVGLPTQATADGMFPRVLSWADRLRLDTPSTVFLAHSRASLNADYSRKRAASFAAMGDGYSPKGVARSRSSIIAHRWFSDSRRGPLSNFVVGTVDQALFAGLRSRYVMLRHLALASKVVVIDEVHAYDVYMQQYFVRVIEWLGAYGVPVILLSATLPSAQRHRFIEAYDRGRRAQTVARDESVRHDGVPAAWGERDAARRRALAAAQEPYTVLDGEIGYPALSRSSAAGSAVVVRASASSPDKTVTLVRCDDDLPGVVALLRSALRSGGNAVVIRNTVRDAQATAAALRDTFAEIPVMLAHSRFLAVDRARRDESLRNLYGRSAGADRPRSSIVVATQVVEQSLDIDFDLMVTDAAPVDLLLQRAGRLHRHATTVRPAPLREPRLVILAEQWDAAPPVFNGGTRAVYDDAILLRTAAVLHGRDVITLPGEIPTLVETVYGRESAFVPADWLPLLEAATVEYEKKQRKKAHEAEAYLLGPAEVRRPTLIGWIDGPDIDPDTTPPGRRTVRDSEETLEVIVLQRDGAGLTTPSWLAVGGGVPIPLNDVPGPWLTKVIRGCTLRLPSGMCHGKALDRHIDALERAFELPNWQASHALKGELVLVFDGSGRARLNEFDLSYSPEDGFDFARSRA